MLSRRHNIHIWENLPINHSYSRFAPIFVILRLPRPELHHSNTPESETSASLLGLTSQILSCNYVCSDVLATSTHLPDQTVPRETEKSGAETVSTRQETRGRRWMDEQRMQTSAEPRAGSRRSGTEYR